MLKAKDSSVSTQARRGAMIGRALSVLMLVAASQLTGCACFHHGSAAETMAPPPPPPPPPPMTQRRGG